MAQKPVRSIDDVPGLAEALANSGPALPDPVGNDGKVLSSDGNDLLWAVLSGGIQEVDEFPPTTTINDPDVVFGLEHPLWASLGWIPYEVDGSVVAMSPPDEYNWHSVDLSGMVTLADKIRIYGYYVEELGTGYFQGGQPDYGEPGNTPEAPGEYLVREMDFDSNVASVYFNINNIKITRVELTGVRHYEYPAEGTIVRHRGLKAWFKFSYDVRKSINSPAYRKWVCFDADTTLHVYVSDTGDNDKNTGLSEDSPVRDPFIGARIFGSAGAGHMHIAGQLGGSEVDQWTLPRVFTLTGRQPDASRVTKQVTFIRPLSESPFNRIGMIVPPGGPTADPLAGWIFVPEYGWRTIYSAPYYGAGKTEVPFITEQGLYGLEMGVPYDFCPADSVTCMLSNVDSLEVRDVAFPWANIVNVSSLDMRSTFIDNEYGSIRNIGYLYGNILGGPIMFENCVMDMPNLYAVSGFDGDGGEPNALVLKNCRGYYPSFQTLAGGQAYSMTEYPAVRVCGGSEVLLNSSFISLGNPLAVGILTNGFAKTVALWGGPRFIENQAGDHFESTTDIGIWEVMD